MAGVSVPLLFYKFVPKWIAVFGLVVAALGVLSWFSIEFLPASFFISITRSPGFVWMIAVGFAMPNHWMKQHAFGNTKAR
jgi:hypothetical protein